MKHIIYLTVTTLALTGATFSTRAADTGNVPASDASATAPTRTDASSSAAFKPAMDEDAWQFRLSVPLWFPQIDGNATVLGHREPVNINYNTLKGPSRQRFCDGCGCAQGEVRFLWRCRLYEILCGERGCILRFEISQLPTPPWLYQLVKTESEHPFILEGTAGVRYWYATTWLSIPALPFYGTKTWESWWIRFLAFAAANTSRRSFHLDFQGDGGGFNISHNTDWNLVGNRCDDLRLSCKYFSLSAGYRALALDESDSGASKNGVNLIFNGAVVGLNFHW